MRDDQERALRTEERDGTWVVRVDGGEHQLFGPAVAEELAELVDRAEADPQVHAVVFTGAHPDRFVSHADVRWLQEGGAETPKVGHRVGSAVVRVAHAVQGKTLTAATRRSPLWGAVQLVRLHETFLKMNTSGVVFVAALNGSTLGLGAEFAWACDLRVIADDSFIGQPEVLLGFNPGGGGTQRLTRLVGTHRGLVAMLEGEPLTAAEALELGAVDDVVPREDVLDRAVERANHLGGRPKDAVRAIKRAAYLGSSQSLDEGLHTERTEFLSVLASDDAQDLMVSYLAALDRDGELPAYDPRAYAEAIRTGSFPGRGARSPR